MRRTSPATRSRASVSASCRGGEGCLAGDHADRDPRPDDLACDLDPARSRRSRPEQCLLVHGHQREHRGGGGRVECGHGERHRVLRRRGSVPSVHVTFLITAPTAAGSGPVAASANNTPVVVNTATHNTTPMTVPSSNGTGPSDPLPDDPCPPQRQGAQGRADRAEVQREPGHSATRRRPRRSGTLIQSSPPTRSCSKSRTSPRASRSCSCR